MTGPGLVETEAERLARRRAWARAQAAAAPRFSAEFRDRLTVLLAPVLVQPARRKRRRAA